MRVLVTAACVALLAATSGAYAQSNGVAKPPTSNANKPPPPTSNRPVPPWLGETGRGERPHQGAGPSRRDP